ncbi:MAG: sigma-E processing peptidase SpoIIGA [Firmicutes bacterium]|nr:sigma-E processing peptidase SpoIIGA [Bacillota bacterium]
MVIYGEVLFLENAAVGALILWMTSRLCNEVLSMHQMVLGSVLCGLYSFTLFQGELHWIWAMLEKLMFSMVLIRLCFHPRQYIKNLLVFYGISFLMGGVTMGIFGLLSVPAVSANGSLYVEQLSWIHLISGVSATVLILRLLVSLIREHRLELRTIRQVTIVHRGKEIHVRGFLDTGNQLLDPESGLPVCLISQELWTALSGEEDPLRMIRYRGATGYEGTLFVLKPDGFQIEEPGRQRSCETVLGVGPDPKETPGWRGCHVLLNGYLTEEFMGFGGEMIG